MRNLILTLGLLFSFNAFAGNGSGNVSAVIGLGAASTATAPSAVPLSNPTGGAGTFATFTLIAGDMQNALTSTNVYPFFKTPTASGGTAYQVTSGKTAYCFDASVISGVTNTNVGLITDTASFAFGATVGSLTSAKFYSGGSGKYTLAASPSANVWTKNPGIYTFPSLSFPGIQAPGSSVVVVLNCYEN